jgi:hypothetical protein
MVAEGGGSAAVSASGGGWTLRPLLFNLALLLSLWLHALLPPPAHPAALRARAPPYAGEYISFNVILTSVGRPTLGRMLGTFAHQLTRHDFISVLSDIDPANAELIRATNATLHAAACHGCTKIFRQNDPPLGAIGHRSRTVHQRTLPGAFHLHADDDDFYTPDAFEIIRSVVTSLLPRVYIFRVAKENYYPAKNRKELIAFPVLENNDPLRVGLYNGGTPCGVVRNVGDELPIWRPTIGGDAVFWEDAIVRRRAGAAAPRRPVWAPQLPPFFTPSPHPSFFPHHPPPPPP